MQLNTQKDVNRNNIFQTSIDQTKEAGSMHLVSSYSRVTVHCITVSFPEFL